MAKTPMYISIMTQQLKETDYIKTWVLFMVCATVGGIIVGAVVGAVVGGVLGAAGVPVRTISALCGVLGFIVGLPISYLFFRLFVSRFIVQKLTAQALSEGELSKAA